MQILPACAHVGSVHIGVIPAKFSSWNLCIKWIVGAQPWPGSCFTPSMHHLHVAVCRSVAVMPSVWFSVEVFALFFLVCLILPSCAIALWHRQLLALLVAPNAKFKTWIKSLLWSSFFLWRENEMVQQAGIFSEKCAPNGPCLRVLSSSRVCFKLKALSFSTGDYSL